MKRVCCIEGCGLPHEAWGYCWYPSTGVLELIADDDYSFSGAKEPVML